MKKIIVQKWEESERGWGTRPDGYSLHLNDSDRQTYIKEYWDRMPSSVPDEYSRPNGSPYEAEIDEKTLAKVTASKNGVRCYGKPPGSGGTNGWVSI